MSVIHKHSTNSWSQSVPALTGAEGQASGGQSGLLRSHQYGSLNVRRTLGGRPPPFIEQGYVYLLIPQGLAIVRVDDTDCHALGKAGGAPRKEGSEDQISKKEPHVTVTLPDFELLRASPHGGAPQPNPTG